MTNQLLRLFALFVLIRLSFSIDLELNRVTCDAGLPIYALDDDLRLSCNGNSRCTFGQTATISGTLYYEGAMASGLSNDTATAYAFGELQLMTLKYQLFEAMPIQFCGEWINNGMYNYADCPSDGTYHFSVDYTLPDNHDFTTWFATGWSGLATLDIFNDTNITARLAYCEMHFHTYTTESNEEGWGSLPTAATVALIALGIIAFMLLLICCFACSPRRKVIAGNEQLAYRLAP